MSTEKQQEAVLRIKADATEIEQVIKSLRGPALVIARDEAQWWAAMQLAKKNRRDDLDIRKAIQMPKRLAA